MAITTSGGWAVGDSREDLGPYLHDYARSLGQNITDLSYAECEQCGSPVFAVKVDDEEGVAVRSCVEGHPAVPMFDSKDYLEESEPGEAACPCGNETFEVAGGCTVGADGEVRWVFVGLRCHRDGVLGCYVDWKIDYAPSRHLISAV